MKKCPTSKSLFIVLSLLIAYNLSLNTDVCALTVDFYQDCESGNNGDVLTPDIMNASSHGVSTWFVEDTNVTPMAVSDNQTTRLPGRVKVRGGATYTDTGTRKWRVNDKWGCNDVACSINLSTSKLTYAMNLTIGPTVCVYNNYDNGGVLCGGNYVSMQQINPDCNGPYLRIHGPLAPPNQTSTATKVIPGKTYWINIHFDGSVNLYTLKIFDPANNYIQVGSATCPTVGLPTMCMQTIAVGRGCGHGDNPNDENQTYFDNIMLDYTDAVFPLLPDIDSSSPTAPGMVRDGTGTSDASFTYSTKALSANWDAASDPECGIEKYWYAIGPVQGGTTITGGWIDNSADTIVTRTGLSLTLGATYYFSVKAENAVGMIGPAANSNGQYVRGDDMTPPSAPAQVRDGLSATADISSTRSTTQLSANWDASTDAESGIFAYYYAIGTSPGGTNVAGWTDNGNNTSVTRTGLSLTTGATYYFSVKAENVAGLQGAAANSNGQFVKALGTNLALSKPVVVSSTESPAYFGGRAVDGNAGTGWASAWIDPSWIYVDLGQVYNLNYVILKWETAYGKAYQIQVSLNGNDWTDVYATTSENGGTDNISFSPAIGCYIRMYGTQRGTAWGYHLYEFEVYGDPVVSDTTPPEAPASVRDGTGTDINFTYSTTQLSANWDANTDAESGISGYKYAIGASAGGTNVVNWMTLWNVTTVTKTGLSLTKGTTYYFSVKAINGSGLESSSAANSNGQYVSGDTTPPSAPAAVRDGASTDIGYTFSTNTLQANWDPSADAESGISKYYFAIGLSPGAMNVTSWTDNGTATAATKTGLTLAVGTTYYFSVKAENGDGLQGTATNSNGQYVVKVDTTDTTPPGNIVSVSDGTGADISYTADTTQLSASWTASNDAESGIAKYYYAIGTTAGGTNIVNWTDDGQLTNVTKTGLTLTVGTTYYFSVKAQNGVGLQSGVTNSNGQCVVASEVEIPPVITNVQAANITANSASISWTTGKQATSQVEYGITAVYGSQTTEDSSLVTAHSVVITALITGQTYHYRVISKDNNGNQAVSTDYTFTTLSTQNPVPDIKAYPNPHDFSNGAPMKFKVGATVTEGGEVRIYTMSGKLVRSIMGINEISWDGRNDKNEKVAKGVYIYTITESNGDKTTGKLAIVK